MKKVTIAFVAVVAAVLIGTNAFTQSANEAIDLGEITVTATKVAQSIESAPVSVVIISKEQLEALPLQNIDDLLGMLAGIDVSVSSGMFEHKGGVSMRGMSSDMARTLVLLDGMQLNNSDSGDANFRSIDPGNIERIEIARGPASALYGAHAMGGVINIITKTPEREFGGTLSLSGGTFETLKQKLTLTGGIQKVDLLFSTSNMFTQGFNGDLPENREAYGSDNTQITERHFFAKARSQLGESGSAIEYSIGIYDDFRGLGSALDPSIYAEAHPDGQYREYDGTRHQISYSKPNSSGTFKTDLFYNREDYKWLRETTGTSGGFPALRNRYLVDSKREDRGIDAHNTWNIAAHNVTAGVGYSIASIEAADDYDYYNYAPSTLSVTNMGNMKTAALYARDTVALTEKTDMNFGLRFDRAEVTGVEYKDQTGFMGTASPDDKSWTHVSPSVGVVHFTSEKTKLRVSYGNAFHAPILDSLTRRGIFRGRIYELNPELEPEEIHSFEVGIDHYGAKFGKALNFYYNIGKDFIYSVDSGATMGGRPVYDWVNLGEAKIYGVEYEMSYMTTAFTKVYFNTTMNHAKVGYFATEDPDLIAIQGKYFTNAPKIKSNIGFIMNHPMDRSFSFNLRYVGNSYSSEDNTSINKAYFWADAQASKHIREDMKLTLEANNLFNKVHINSATRTVGINWELKADYEF
ncbi:MAG TPA: TonB-dependent receptor [bacterium]|nr:TonB-dependent receptor [bacterium]